MLGMAALSVALAHGAAAVPRDDGTAAASRAAPANPEEFVNILGGTQSKEDFSYGNIMPDTTLPWGFNAWAPQTNNAGNGWWFTSWDRSFYGFRCTHQPSPWIGDYGVLRFSGGIIDESHHSESLFSAVDTRKSDLHPYYQNHTLLAYGSRDGYLTAEIAPTEHGAIMRYNFPPYVARKEGGLAPGWNQTRRVWVSLNGGGGAVNANGSGPDADTGAAAPVLSGYTTAISRCKGCQHHFHATVFGGADGSTPIQPFATGTDKGWGWLDFDPKDANTQQLVVRVATSMISASQAQTAHAAEVEKLDLESAVAAAKAVWNAELAKITIDDMGPGYTPQEEHDWRVGFYSSLYRASKFPRKLFEQDASGKDIHWSPSLGKVVDGVFSCDQVRLPACLPACRRSGAHVNSAARDRAALIDPVAVRVGVRVCVCVCRASGTRTAVRTRCWRCGSRRAWRR